MKHFGYTQDGYRLYEMYFKNIMSKIVDLKNYLSTKTLL